jgi:hypothetical protein
MGPCNPTWHHGVVASTQTQVVYEGISAMDELHIHHSWGDASIIIDNKVATHCKCIPGFPARISDNCNSSQRNGAATLWLCQYLPALWVSVLACLAKMCNGRMQMQTARFGMCVCRALTPRHLVTLQINVCMPNAWCAGQRLAEEIRC